MSILLEIFSNNSSRAINKPIKYQAGFTLIEVLISIFLVAAGTAIFLNVWMSPRLASSAANKIIASKIALKQIEILRATSSALSASSRSISDADLSLLTQGSGTLVISNYSADGKLKQAYAIIEWLENNAKRSFRIDTLINK